MSRPRIVVLLAIVSIPVGITTRGNAAPFPCASGPSEVKTLTVETEWSSKTYSAGANAKVKVTVSRPGPEDPLDLGLPWPIQERVPAEGVEVTTAISGVYPPAGSIGETDDQGRVVLKFKIPKHLRGPFDTFTDAKLLHRVAGDCTDIQERGWKSDKPAFVVTD